MQTITKLDLSIKLKVLIFVPFFAIAVASHRGLAQGHTEPTPAEKQKIDDARTAKRDSFKIAGVHHTVKLPSNFPLPVYSSNVFDTNFANSVKGTPVAQAIIMTKDPAKTVFDWYKTQCASSGWQVRTPKQSAMSAKEKSGQLFIMNALKGEQQSTVMCTTTAKHPNTVISITWMKHK